MQKFYTSLFFLFILLANFSLYGQNFAGTKLELFPDKKNIYIDDLTFDSKGFIWFLSKGEIYRFNGYKSVSLMKILPEGERQQEVFNSILIDSEDKLWIAGIQKLYVFDLKTWKVREFPQKKLPQGHDLEILDIKESPRNQIFVRYNNGNMAIITNDKVHIVSNLYSHKVQSRSNSIIWSFEFWNDRAWLGSTSGKLYSIGLESEHRIKTYVIDSLQTTIAEIVPQHNHLILSGLWRSRFFKFEVNCSTGFFVEPIQKQFSEVAIWAKIWNYGTEKNKNKPSLKQGFQNRENFLKRFLQQNNIADVNAIEVLNRDLFIATSDGIWVVFEKTRGISTLIPKNTINSSVRDIYQFEDRSLFLCSYGGAEYIHKNGKTHYFKDFFAGYNILPLDNNRILISMQGSGVKIFDKRDKRFHSLQYIVPKTIGNKKNSFPKYVLSLAQDEQFIYLGTAKSLFRLNKKSRLLEPLLERFQGSLSKFRVNHISVQKNGLFLSTSLGFIKFHHGKLEKIFPKKQNLGIYKHIFHQDTIWLATKGLGLVGIDPKGGILKTFDKKNGLGGNIAYNFELAMVIR